MGAVDRAALGRPFVAGVAGLAFVIAPVAVQAQTCSSLNPERVSINRQARTLGDNNPGSTLVFMGCVAAGSSNYDQNHSVSDALSAFTLCAGFGCAFTDSYQNCISVGGQLFMLALRVADIETRMRRQGCL